jgi:hypothetical protein
MLDPSNYYRLPGVIVQQFGRFVKPARLATAMKNKQTDGGSSSIEGQELKGCVRGPGVRGLFQPGDELVKGWKRE